MTSEVDLSTIQPYITLGWYTVPLRGKLERMPDGEKTIPDFPTNWRNVYSEEFNNSATKLGGAITGKLSNIVAIDCDNETIYNIFKSLDPDYEFVFMSVGKKNKAGKPKTCGTFIYRYEEDLDFNLKVKNEHIELDFFSNGGFIYLATEANKTKSFVAEMPELRSMPAAAKALLLSWNVKARPATQATTTTSTRMHLNILANRLVNNKTYLPELFRILTPKDFRDEPQYRADGHLHPDNVPVGRGSEYMSKVSAILGSDESIDEDLYVKVMNIVNNFFSKPIEKTRLMSTIIEPMVEERASIDGVPIWRHNPDWMTNRVLVTDKLAVTHEVLFDPDRMLFYLIDELNGKSKSFAKDNECISYLETVSVTPPSKRDFKLNVPLVNVYSDPRYEFGFVDNGSGRFMNTFRHSLPMTILNNPESYKSSYTTPKHILQFMESLVPDNYMRNYLLGFLKRKLLTFDYSPVILYFLGVSGAGKDTFVELVARFIGAEYIAKPSAKEFLEMQNGWLLDKYFMQLDEYGNQLTQYHDKENALGKIKTLTGSNQIQIRKMHTDGYPYMHSITTIMTANVNPLLFDSDDRRVALFSCTNCLKLMDWVIAAGGMATVLKLMWAEINDFAYYLATEVNVLSTDDYNSPPDTLTKRTLIAASFNAGQRIFYLINNGMFSEFEELCLEYDKLYVAEPSFEGRLYEDDLFDLYFEITEGKGTKRALVAAIKDLGKVPTTKNGVKAYYYNAPKFRGKRVTAFAPVTDPESENKPSLDL